MTRAVGLRHWPWLVLVVCWFAFGALRPLLDPDEGRYAEIPREMLADADWVTPRLNGLDYLEKPPLQYWATAAAYSVFGFSELSARAWALCLTLLAVGLVGAMGGTLAAAALATSPYFLLVGQLNLLDGAFATLLCGALCAFLAAQRTTDGRRTRKLMLLTWGLLALAVLQKGIAAPLLAGITLCAYSLLARDFRIWRRLHPVRGLVLFLAIAAGWFILVSRRNPDFPYFFFVHEHFERFLTTAHNHAEPWWFFVPIVAVGMLPWIGRWRAAFVAAWRAEGGPYGFREPLFLLLWCAVVIAFFSASGSKLTPYVMPAMPALALLLAPAIEASPRSSRAATRITALLLLALAVLLVIAGRRRGGADGVPPDLILWTTVAAGAGLVALALTLRRVLPGDGDWRIAVACAALGWPALLAAYTAMPPLRTAKPLVEQVRAEIRPGTALFTVGQYRQTIPPYLGRTLRIAWYKGEFEYQFQKQHAGRIEDLGAFAAIWRAQHDAVAFLSPDAFRILTGQGLPGRILADDGRTIAMARQ